MPRAAKPSRSQARARRGQVPAARVHGLTVVDPAAQTWQSQVVCWAPSPEVARELQRAAGFAKGNSEPLPADRTSGPEFAFAADSPGQLFLRRGHDTGFSRWYALPAGYDHRGGDAGRLLPGEPASPAEEFESPRFFSGPMRQGRLRDLG